MTSYVNAVSPATGQPGSDPSHFLPERRGLFEVLRLPPRIREPWLKAFRDEFAGLVKMNVFKPGFPGPNDAVVPIMDIYKCKLNPNGEVDKLKVRGVFRGDLYTQDRGATDTFCPHATMVSVKLFLAECAAMRQRPWQADMVQAYVNVAINRPGIFVKLPTYWKPHLPVEIQHLVGVPLELVKALYGYHAAGLCLYKAQAHFLQNKVFKNTLLSVFGSSTFPTMAYSYFSIFQMT